LSLYCWHKGGEIVRRLADSPPELPGEFELATAGVRAPGLYYQLREDRSQFIVVAWHDSAEIVPIYGDKVFSYPSRF
jgi:hypothetical protein